MRLPVRQVTKRIKIQIGYGCNAKCSFCYYYDKLSQKNLPSSMILEELDLARSLGFEDLDFSGGEPTLSPMLEKSIEHAKELGFKDIGIITNGMVISNSRMLEKYVKSGLSDVLLSIHGSKAEVHDSLTNIPGSFDRILSAARNSTEFGIKVRTNYVITKSNYTDLVDYANLLSTFVPHSSNFIFFNPWATGVSDLVKLTPKFDEAKIYLQSAIDILKEAGVEHVNVRYVPFCTLDEKYFGNIVDFPQRLFDQYEWQYPFTEFSEWIPEEFVKRKEEPFDLRDAYAKYVRRHKIMDLRYARSMQDLKDIVGMSPNIEQIKSPKKWYKKIPACHECELSNECDGIKNEYLEIFGGSEFRPIKIQEINAS